MHAEKIIQKVPFGNKMRRFNITVIQACAPTTNAKEAAVEWFYEDFIKLTPKKMSFSS